jgi:predicted MFS family arabinose efflux permease
VATLAAGYIYGGLVGAALGWRAAFLLEGLLMVPFVVFCFASKPLHLTGSRDHGPGKPPGHMLLFAFWYSRTL